MIDPRKMPGCAKTMFNDQLTVVVAGGQDQDRELKSVEMISLDINANQVSTWKKLGDLNYARSYFPSVGIIDSSLIVTAGKLTDESGKHSVEKFQNGTWRVWDAIQLRTPKSSHSTVRVTQEWC